MEFIKGYDEGKRDTLKYIVPEAIKANDKKWEKRIKHGVGQMRQWLNEDRITDKSLVDNSDLLFWFDLEHLLKPQRRDK